MDEQRIEEYTVLQCPSAGNPSYPKGDVDSYVNPPDPRDQYGLGGTDAGWFMAAPFIREWMWYGFEDDTRTWPEVLFDKDGNWSARVKAKNCASNNTVRYYLWFHFRLTDPTNMAELKLIKIWEGYFGSQYQQFLHGSGRDPILKVQWPNLQNGKIKILFAAQQEHKPHP